MNRKNILVEVPRISSDSEESHRISKLSHTASEESLTSLESNTLISISNRIFRDSEPRHKFDEQTIRDSSESNEASSSTNNSGGSSRMPISSHDSTHTAESVSLGRGRSENDRQLATYSWCGFPNE